MSNFLETYRRLRTLAHEWGFPLAEYPETPRDTGEDLLKLCTQLNIDTYKWARQHDRFSSETGDAGHQQKLPEGYWYFYTLTQPAGKSEQDMRDLHAISLRYFELHGITPYLISLEKSAIYHTHGLVRCKSYAKNLARDLSRHCNGYRTHVSHKISSAKEFNRIMNYIRKQGYDDDETNLEIILENKI